jgi:predicted amidohydrolase
LKIGFIQFSPVLGDLQTTIRNLDRLLKGVESADILVLPELCNSGYRFTSKTQAWDTSEVIGESPFIKYLQSMCKRHGYYFVTGLNEREGDHLYNAALLVGSEGCLGKYRKLHLFMNEKDYFEPGNLGLPVFDIGLCRIGMLVCFDWVFPEAWRILALKNAQLICHPSNLVLPGLAQRAVPVHALTNAVYIVTANRIGTEGDLTFTGLSMIANPKGVVLARASQKKEATMVVEIDVTLANDKQITPRNHVIRDRRPEYYHSLVDPIRE